MTRFLLLIHPNESCWEAVPDDVKHAHCAARGGSIEVRPVAEE